MRGLLILARRTKMRIVLHDYCGHPFQIQLSREMARHGHQVHHIFSDSIQSPHGNMNIQSSDPDGFNVKAISLDQDVSKYSYFKRYLQEKHYGKELVKTIKELAPDVIISANTPVFIQKKLLKKTKPAGIRFIIWLQDLWSLGVKRIICRKIPVIGDLIGNYFIHIEKYCLCKSDGCIVISSDFIGVLSSWGIDTSDTQVIENWAPLEEVPQLPRDNEWAKANGLSKKFCFLYSGTIGLKHNPLICTRLAQRFQSENVAVVVVSEGLGADILNKEKQQKGIKNLHILPFQPFEQLPSVLASADVLFGVLEADAGVFSVPSKVLTYHCAGRPILLSVPSANLAARIVKENQTGITTEPNDEESFLMAAEKLYRDAGIRKKLAANARRYAERTFDIHKITGKFEEAIQIALRKET